jgi:hypothetical protein
MRPENRANSAFQFWPGITEPLGDFADEKSIGHAPTIHISELIL